VDQFLSQIWPAALLDGVSPELRWQRPPVQPLLPRLADPGENLLRHGFLQQRGLESPKPHNRMPLMEKSITLCRRISADSHLELP
jgi:hypothetical protein